MKNIKRFSAVIGAAALLALAFTSCDTFAGTEVNYGEKEKALTGATGATVTNLGTATISQVIVQGFINGDIDKASTQTTIEVEITNGATGERIDLGSAKKAISFWSLKKNSDANFYDVRDAELPAKVFGEKESASTSNSTATIEFEVDTSSVETSRIALVVDAKKLKDKKGKLILNLDHNNKRGEESDSYIKYIKVSHTKDGTAIGYDTLNLNPEDFRPEWGYLNNLQPNDGVVGWSPIDSGSTWIFADTNDKNEYTGEYVVGVIAAPYPQEKWDDTPKVNKELSAELNKAFSLRIKEANSSTPSTKSLSFAWDEDAGYYKSAGVKINPGATIDVIQKFVDFSKYVPGWYTEMYGHPAFTAAWGNGAKDKASSYGRADVYVESPDYIIQSYSTTEVEWDLKNCTFDKDAIQTAQRDFLKATSFNGRFCTVKLGGIGTKPGDVEISGKDFIVVDKYNDIEYKLPFKMKEKFYDGDADEDHAGKLMEIEFEITNKNISLHTPKLYVGSGVTLKENKGNATQVKFGQFKDTADGIHSGYVALN